MVLYVENKACVDLPGIVHRQLGDLQLPDLSGLRLKTKKTQPEREHAFKELASFLKLTGGNNIESEISFKADVDSLKSNLKVRFQQGIENNYFKKVFWHTRFKKVAGNSYLLSIFELDYYASFF